MPTLLPIPDHLSLNQAAPRLGCSRQRVLAFAAAGLLAAVPMGGRLFFSVAEVEALAERLAAPPEKATKRARSRP